jgi:hypothetical protein
VRAFINRFIPFGRKNPGATRETWPGVTLTLSAKHDVAAISAAHEQAQTWLTARSGAGFGCITLEDPQNPLSLQLAAAIGKSAQSLGLDVQIVGPTGTLPENIRFAQDAEVSA